MTLVLRLKELDAESIAPAHTFPALISYQVTCRDARGEGGQQVDDVPYSRVECRVIDESVAGLGPDCRRETQRRDHQATEIAKLASPLAMRTRIVAPAVLRLSVLLPQARRGTGVRIHGGQR